jgi:hypothetical protein
VIGVRELLLDYVRSFTQAQRAQNGTVQDGNMQFVDDKIWRFPLRGPPMVRQAVEKPTGCLNRGRETLWRSFPTSLNNSSKKFDKPGLSGNEELHHVL